MRNRIVMTALVLSMTPGTGVWAAAEEAKAGETAAVTGYSEAFARLTALVGSWEIDGSPSIVTYSMTGNGTAVIEEFRGRRGMASVYHMDGNDLRMTHYCSAANQPRMKAIAWDADERILKFDFVDVTNVSEPDAYYTRQLEIVFEDDDHIRLMFNGLDHGEEAPVSHALTRRDEAVSSAAQEQARRNDFSTAFEGLKNLVGTWDVADSERVVTYRLTGNNSTLIEQFIGEPAMTSVYHMDNGDLRLTHYCNAGNQPRMKASAWDSSTGALKFDFVDVTNLTAPGAYHTRELEIVIRNDDHIELRFNGRKDGKDIPSVLELSRRSFPGSGNDVNP